MDQFRIGGWRFSEYRKACSLGMMVGVNNSEDEYFFIQTGVWLYMKVSDDMKSETRVELSML